MFAGGPRPSSPELILYDDDRARAWHPFSLVRPAGEMLFGVETLRARAERVLGIPCAAHLTPSSLAGFEEAGAPRCLAGDGWDGAGRIDQRLSDPAAGDPSGGRLFLNSRFVPAEPAGGEPHPFVRSAPDAPCGESPSVLTLDQAVVGVWLPGAESLSLAWLRSGAGATDAPPWPRHPLDGTLLESPWQLMSLNAGQIRSDESVFGEMHSPPVHPGGVVRVGAGAVAAASGASVEPGVTLDTTEGPILLAPGAAVRGPARLEGPLYVGEGATILGGVVGASSIGPGCRIRGEVQSCVVLGFSNKAHDGFLGHSVVGRWVNLGALTTNSDLKNTYGAVRAATGAGGSAHTGLTKAGCLIGDHVRTGIGTLINTGTVLGAGSNVFGGRMPPPEVPPFSWGVGTDLVDYELERFVETAAIVMARRGQTLSTGMRELYRSAWRRSVDARTGPRAMTLAPAPPSHSSDAPPSSAGRSSPPGRGSR